MNSEYRQMEAALRYVAAHFRSKPSLADLAAQSGLSEWHFQRKFTRWAGVSPKRFMQYLTVEEAKARLAASRSLLHAAFDSGLSGPGRLHDLFVSIEAMTPGEYARGGEGLVLRYGIHATPYGFAAVVLTPRGLCHLGFADADDEAALRDQLEREWPRAALIAAPAETQAVIDRIFSASSNPPASLTLHLRGTNFQLQVWRALLAIPPGHVITYGDLAAQTGHAGACRAVGNAVGANPVAYLIPCHRVIRELGGFGAYRWGVPRKLALLGREFAAHPTAGSAVPAG